MWISNLAMLLGTVCQSHHPLLTFSRRHHCLALLHTISYNIVNWTTYALNQLPLLPDTTPTYPTLHTCLICQLTLVPSVTLWRWNEVLWCVPSSDSCLFTLKLLSAELSVVKVFRRCSKLPWVSWNPYSHIHCNSPFYNLHAFKKFVRIHYLEVG